MQNANKMDAKEREEGLKVHRLRLNCREAGGGGGVGALLCFSNVCIEG